MAWTSGSATSQIDLCDKLVTFLSTNAALVAAGQEWEILRNSAFPMSIAWFGRLAFHSSSASFPIVAPDAPPFDLPSTFVKLRVAGTLVAPTAGTYSFSLRADEQALVRINGAIVGGVYSPNFVNSFVSSFDVVLSAGNHTLEVIYAHSSDTTYGLALGWKKPGDGAFSIIPSANYSGMTAAWGMANTTNPSQADLLALEKDKEYVLKGPGLSDSEEIFLHLETVSSVQADSYNVRLHYSVGFDPVARRQNQPGLSSSPVYLLGWNQATPYWFVGSGRRFMVVAKVSTTYANLYGGFYLPYGLPSEIPLPICAGGNGNANVRWSVQSDVVGSFWNPACSGASSASLVARRTDGNADLYGNIHDLNVPSTVSGRTYPYSLGTAGANSTSQLEMRTSPDGSYALQPVVMHSGASGSNVWGELDGIFHVSGFNNSSESIITVDSINYLVMQASYRTRASDYAALRLQ